MTTASQATDKTQIIITHYINPSMFWFKNQLSDSMQLLSHETEIQEFARHSVAKSIFSDGYQPVVGEIVLLKNFFMDKWVRCKVDDVIEFSGIPEYTVWLIDYGYPLRTQARWILPLHKTLAEVEIPLIYKGGVANIVPATKVFNLETAEPEVIKTDNWSEYAVMTVEKILTENDIVSFAAEYKINNHYFGNIEVLTYRGKSIEIRNVLVSLNYGRLSNNLQEFSQYLTDRRMTNFERFESQARLSSFSVKKNQMSYSLEIKVSNNLAMAAVPTVDSLPKNRYTQKVNEWNERNIREPVVNNNITDCPPLPENPLRSRSVLQNTPNDVVESNKPYAGSKDRCKNQERNTNNFNTNTTISDFLARLDIQKKIGNIPTKLPEREPPMIPAGFRLDQIHTVTKPNRADYQKGNFERKPTKQYDQPEKRLSEAQSDEKSTFSIADFEEVNWSEAPKFANRSLMEQDVQELHKSEHIRDSTSGLSSDELGQLSSGSSKVRRRSALSMARRKAKEIQ